MNVAHDQLYVRAQPANIAKVSGHSVVTQWSLVTRSLGRQLVNELTFMILAVFHVECSQHATINTAVFMPPPVTFSGRPSVRCPSVNAMSY